MEHWGKYQLLYKLAQGGMAEIFVADHLGENGDAGQRVCIKRIRPEFSDDTDFLQMFAQEARIATAISHPNVVRVFDFDSYENRCFIAMEYVDGFDLKKVISSAADLGVSIPVGFAFHVFKSVLGALEAASEVEVDGKVQAVVHRDISPHNIMVARDGVVKLTDFGIARARGSSRVTRTGVIKGKLAYLSPEQAASKEVGPSSDLFCLGLVLYEMLSGQRFNRGKSEGEMLAAVMHPARPNIPWYSREINQFLQRLLAASPLSRFATPAEALEGLNQLSLPRFTVDDASRLVMRLPISDLKSKTDVFKLPEISLTGADTVREEPVWAPTEPTAETEYAPVDQKPAQPARTTNVRARILATVAVLSVVVFSILILGLQKQRESHDVAGNMKRVTEDATVKRGPLPLETGKAEPDRKSGLAAENLIVKLEGEAEPVAAPLLSTTESAGAVLPEKAEPQMPSGENISSQAHKTADEEKAHSTGNVQILCRPWANVRIDGEFVGTTPVLNRKLKSGKHLVELINDELKYAKKITISVRSGRTVKISERIDGQSVSP